MDWKSIVYLFLKYLLVTSINKVCIFLNYLVQFGFTDDLEFSLLENFDDENLKKKLFNWFFLYLFCPSTFAFSVVIIKLPTSFLSMSLKPGVLSIVFFFIGNLCFLFFSFVLLVVFFNQYYSDQRTSDFKNLFSLIFCCTNLKNYLSRRRESAYVFWFTEQMPWRCEFSLVLHSWLWVHLNGKRESGSRAWPWTHTLSWEVITQTSVLAATVPNVYPPYNSTLTLKILFIHLVFIFPTF